MTKEEAKSPASSVGCYTDRRWMSGVVVGVSRKLLVRDVEVRGKKRELEMDNCLVYTSDDDDSLTR